jgi:hypothetical protein
MVKVHKARHYQDHGEARVRSACGRASGFIWNLDTIDNRQNLSDDDSKITCTFCLRMLAAQNKRNAT